MHTPKYFTYHTLPRDRSRISVSDLVLQSLVKHEDIMESTTPIALCTAKNNDLNAKASADFTRTIAPWPVPQNSLVFFASVSATVEYFLVTPKCRERLLERT